MNKKLLILGLIPAAFYLNAQDISTIRNTAEIYSNSPNIGSARYTAMAGAMGALGGDISSINANPAGIGVFITGEANATVNFSNKNNKSTIQNSTYERSMSNTNFAQAGGVMAFSFSEGSKWKFFNIGVNYSQQNIENYLQTRGNSAVIQQNLVDNSGSNVIGTFTNDGHVYDRVGDLTRLNIAVGANYDNQIYIGGSVNVSGANIEQYDTQRFILDLNNRAYDFNKVYTPFAEDATGISVSAGVIAKLNNQFRVGATIESPTWWSIERQYTEQYLDNNNNVMKGVYNEDRSLTSPMKLGLSAAFVPNKNFAVNVDYKQGVSKPKYKVQGPAETELNEFLEADYKNISEIKIGAEYRHKGFRARGGYGYASSPFKENILSGKTHTLGLGLGYDFKTFYVDATYQNISSDYRNVYGYGSYFSESISLPRATTSYSSDVKNNQNNFLLTLGWKF